jgi:hypothetical protein
MLKRVARGDREGQTGGRYKGRVPTARRQGDEIIRLKLLGVRPSEIASKLGIGRACVYRVLCEQNVSERQEAALPTTSRATGRNLLHHSTRRIKDAVRRLLNSYGGVGGEARRPVLGSTAALRRRRR